MALIKRNSQSSLYKGLSSFWLKYFKDSPQLESIYVGVEQLFAQVYLDLMEVVLSKSLADIPVFKKEEYKVIILQEDQYSFDASVRSNASRTVDNIVFSVEADQLNEDLDETRIIFYDLDSTITYPYVGIFNQKVVDAESGDPKRWSIVVPSNKTIVECIKDVHAHVISGQKITTAPAGSDIEFVLLYNEGEAEIKVTITALERTGWGGNVTTMVTQLNTKLTHSNVSASLEAGYLFIRTTVGNKLRVVYANEQATATLFLKAFNFKFSVSIPQEIQATAKWDFTTSISLRTSGYKAAGSEYKYKIGGPGSIKESAVASSTNIRQAEVTFKALAVSTRESYDGHSINLVNLANVGAVHSAMFPNVGIYSGKLAGYSVQDNVWVAVVPNGKTVEESLKDLQSRVISSKSVTVFSGPGDIEFTLSYNSGESVIAVTITQSEQASITSQTLLMNSLNLKINHTEINVAFTNNHLVIQTSNNSKPLRIIKANQYAESVLFFKVFPFTISSELAPSVTTSPLWGYTSYLSMITGGYKAPEYTYNLAQSTDATLRSAKYMTNTLYAPSLILEETKHYRIQNGFIYFKTNPFELDNIAYRVLGSVKQVAFWMGDVLYDNELLHTLYGYKYLSKREASAAYKHLIRGIAFYYISGPAIKPMTSALNIVAGLPVILENDEVVTAIESEKITTSKNEYVIPSTLDPTVSVGDTVHVFDTIVDAFKVEDYIITPTWFEQISVPESLMPGASPEQRSLKKSVVIPVVGDTSYLVGNLDPSAQELLTDSILSANLPSDGYFEVEFLSEGIKYPFLIPSVYTVVNSINELVSVLQKLSTQVSGVVAQGTTLDTKATFYCNGSQIELAAGVYPDLSTIAGLLTAAIQQQITSSDIQVKLNPGGNTLIFVSPSGQNISISSVSPTAKIVLGIHGMSSYTNLSITAQENKIKFRSLVSTSLVRIVNINNSALNNWSMQPLLSGSGNMVGEQGQPNLAYQLFNDILKYTTFKVSFPLSSITTETDLETVLDIVMTGKPKYVTPLVTPIQSFSETYSGIQDVPGIGVDDGNEATVDVVPKSQMENFPPEGINNAYFNAEIGLAPDLLFSVFDKSVIYYDDNMEESWFEEPGKAGKLQQVHHNTAVGAPIEYTYIKVEAKTDSSLGLSNHVIKFGVQGKLEATDSVLFPYPGIHNYGVRTRGESSSITTMSNQAWGPGIYVIDSTKPWVYGRDRVEIDKRATHMFIMDTSLTNLGFGEGAYLELQGWQDSANNGKFSILNVSYGVPHKTIGGQTVDIIWYQNTTTGALADNYALGHLKSPTTSKYLFHHRSDWVSKQWFITVPWDQTEGKPVTLQDTMNKLVEIRDEGSLSDDSEYFPFDIRVVGDSSVRWPPASGATYPYQVITTEREPLRDRSAKGEVMQVAKETNRKFLIGSGYQDHFSQSIKKYTIQSYTDVKYTNPPAAGVTLPYTINLLGRIIGEKVASKTARVIGEATNEIKTIATHTIGTPRTYRGSLGTMGTTYDSGSVGDMGDFATLDALQIIIKDA